MPDRSRREEAVGDPPSWMEGNNEDESSSSSSVSEEAFSSSLNNNGDGDSHGSVSDSKERATRDFSLALPREHSYLEESHPLLPDADRYRRVDSSYDPLGSGNCCHPGSSFPVHRKDELQQHRIGKTTHELAVLQLHGVVLFPGSTIPVKLQNRSMIRYLGKKIQLCRTDPVTQPRVLIGILPYDSSPQPRSRYNNSSNNNERISSRRRRRPPDDGRRDGEERIRRGSWMRQRFSFGNGEIAATASSHRLRHSITRLRDEFQFLDPEDESDSENDDDDDDDSGLRFANSDDDNDDDDNDDLEESRQFLSHHPPLQQMPKPSHPLVGRIGTIATVQHTHERTARMRIRNSDNSSISSSTPTSASALWGHYEEAPELVFTAVGTSRFRIISCINNEQDIFEVEELVEASPIRPPFSSAMLPFRGIETMATTATISTRSTKLPTPSERMAWNLSQLTPLPYSVYMHRTPWSLVEKIAAALKTNDGKGNLPSLGDDAIVTNRSKLEPRIFSYWMANNAPFSERERLKLLKMDSVLERLLYIWKAVEKLTTSHNLSNVCCGLCGIPLAHISQIFVVGGAEGTTSTYVNGHGFIHQITTLRKVIDDENRISFREFPSTDNSYFPGYSWWITCCNRCGSMLGWKFQKVASQSRDDSDNDNDDVDNEDANNSVENAVVDRDTPERPPYFYGFMSSNVKIVSRSSSTAN